MLLERLNRDKSPNVKSDATGRALLRLWGGSPLLAGSLGPPGADCPVGLHPFLLWILAPSRSAAPEMTAASVELTLRSMDEGLERTDVHVDEPLGCLQPFYNNEDY